MTENKVSKAYSILKTYDGPNNQIRYWKKLYENQKFILEQFSTDYILKNYNYNPIDVNKTVGITSEYGQHLQNTYNLEFLPVKINISRIIGEIGESYHCYIQFRKSIPHSLMYINKKHILNDLFTIDYKNLNIDFDYFDNMPTNGGRKLKEHQKIGAKFLVANKKCVLADSMGLGKALSINELIPTPTGFKKMKDLELNDKIFDSNGDICYVQGIFPQGVRPIYQVKFSDNTVCECDLEHLWIVKSKEDNDWQVKSLQEIIDNDFKQQKYIIPTQHHVNYKYSRNKISSPKFGEQIEEKNIDFIPEEYKINSYQNRKLLIRGLLNKNGELNEKNEIYYITQHYQLAKDIVEIVNSMGCLAKIEDYEENKYKIIFNLNFNPFFWLENSEKFELYQENLIVKSINMINGVENKNEWQKEIIDIQYLRDDEAICIKVNSPDSSFLATRNYIVTHNTTTSIIGALAGGYQKILVITTASLKTTWKKDLVLYENEENIEIVNGRTWKPGARFTVINYDIIQNFYSVAEEPVYEYEPVYDVNGNLVKTLKVPVYVKDKNGNLTPKMQKSRNKALIQEKLANSPLFLEGYDCVIIDEAQKLSNNKSIRYKTISDFLKKANPEAIYLCTGTPLTNRPINLFHILKLIDADVTKDYYYYIQRYCGGKKFTKKDGKEFWTMGDATNLEELREKIKNIYIRRLASETNEMVNKLISKRYYDLNDKQLIEYNRLWNEYVEAQEEDKQDESEQYRQLVEGMLIRQYLAKEMTEHTIQLTDELLEDGEKVVIMTNFQEEMDILVKYYDTKCVTYNGKMNTKEKDKAQNEFMNNKNVKVFIGNIEASGVGLSLPIARKLIFNSFSWSEASNRQAEDRIYRLTQTEDIEIIYQLFNDTWAQQMFDKVLYKGYIMDTLVKSENQKNILK